MQPVLSVEEVREFIQDKVEKNHLLEGEEFSATQISLAMDICISQYDCIIPISSSNIYTFPNKAILLYGTLATIFEGTAALLGRNHLNYSDGGLSIMVEERIQLYQSLAQMYRSSFDTMARAYKLQMNISEGWGSVGSDYANFPVW